jgi:hypothetical protein
MYIRHISLLKAALLHLGVAALGPWVLAPAEGPLARDVVAMQPQTPLLPPA